MNNSKKSLTFTIGIGVVGFLLWKFSGIGLSQPIPVDYSMRPYFPTESTFYEWMVYFLFAVLLSACFYFPFYVSGKINSSRAKNGVLLSVAFLFLLIGYVSGNIKGVVASNWFGEDYGFGVNIFKMFFIAPVFYFVLNQMIFTSLPFRSLVYFFFMNFVVFYLSNFISHPAENTVITPVAFILLDGHFVFFYALAFGVIGWDAACYASQN